MFASLYTFMFFFSNLVVGPHFSEYISFYVDDDCTVMLTCKVKQIGALGLLSLF